MQTSVMAIRVLSGITQKEMAKRAGVGCATYWRYEHGYSVRSSTIEKIDAAVTEVTESFYEECPTDMAGLIGMIHCVTLELATKAWVRPKR